MDTLVNPGDNFDAYVNGTWEKKNEIPADKASYGIFEILDDQSQVDVKKLLKLQQKEILKTVQTNKNRRFLPLFYGLKNKRCKRINSVNYQKQ